MSEDLFTRLRALKEACGSNKNDSAIALITACIGEGVDTRPQIIGTLKHLDYSRPIVSFAGVWRSTDDGAVFAFLTTEPNPLVEPIHPKAMPVLLDEQDEERWLTCSFDEAVSLARPFRRS